ncbi:MAG: DUF5684 domain-containing protein [Oscillospiraceae bacterium]
MSEGISFIIGFAIFFWVIGLGVAVLVIIATWKVYEKAGEPGWASLVPFYRDYVMFKISWGNGWYFLFKELPSVLYLIFYIPFSIGLTRGILSGYSGYGGYPLSSFDMLPNIAGFSALIFLFSTAMLVISIITYVKLAKAFGQGGGFACGLIFLAPVFLCIIAFSKNIYYVGIPGKMPTYDKPAYGNPSGAQSPNWQNPYYQSNGYQQPYSGASPNQYGPTQGWGWQAPEAPRDAASQRSGDFVKFCPDCGSPMKKDDMFCPKCGRPQ